MNSKLTSTVYDDEVSNTLEMPTFLFDDGFEELFSAVEEVEKLHRDTSRKDKITYPTLGDLLKIKPE